MLINIIKSQTARQLVKFGFVGLSNTAIDFFVYLSLTRIWSFWAKHFWLANVISFLVATTWSFFFNRHWTFKDSERGRLPSKYSKFVLVNLVGVGINTLILYLLVTYLGVYDIVAKAAAVAVVMFWGFFANKFWTFKPKTDISGDQTES